MQTTRVYRVLNHEKCAIFKKKVKLDLNNKLQQLMQKNKIRFKIHIFAKLNLVHG